MHFVDSYTAERAMNLYVEDALRQAELRRLARRARIEPYGQLARPAAQRLAQLLVALGARLVSYGLPPYRPAEADARR